ncbi:hypothetical protein COY90_03270 [Candidatus Roizmanbacteria bacterium CG_4_10_14_0_8_um_filter_39_9]|uniref:Uncharacterized protein n=1 Tax=Candidatus Roizmanbacteria bacterium CG_4_10_14_0_8_um_filter_39_9 TaxID=1974829 RepID=A0A2M7QDK4_9BACT|nr:MAG: hypothetical protein COY90_03270 [Candidatus Roizmanbacteria bacterium CG_4_10_14_0_8_um_filter_39_9]
MNFPPDQTIRHQDGNTTTIYLFMPNARMQEGWSKTNPGHNTDAFADSFQPGIKFVFGKYGDSGIPHIDIVFVGHEGQISEYNPFTSENVTEFINIGLSSHPNLLPDAIRSTDTRTAPNTVHSNNTIFSPVTIVPVHTNFDLPTSISNWAQKLNQHGIPAVNGVFMPAMAGCWNDKNQYIIPVEDRGGAIVRTAPELWLSIEQDQLKDISKPISAEKEFGSMDPETTFLEFLKMLRYGMRYERSLNNDEYTRRALQIGAGSIPINEKLLPDVIRQKIKAEGINTWWHIDIIREMTASLFYNPKNLFCRAPN